MEETRPSPPAWFSTVGIIFALGSGFFIGLSIILQKKGLLATKSRDNREYDYLKNLNWQLGIASMVIGELSNFLAYSFIPAVIVAPLGAISVVVAAILAHFMLKERLSFSGTIGIILCILGSVVVVLHGPHSTQTETIPEFYYYVFAPGFLVYTFIMLILLLWLVFKAGPIYGESQPVVYLAITSIGGSYLVNAAQGFGSSLIYTIRNFKSSTVQNWNQFEYWGIYPLMVFIVCSAIFQINYLNKSLKHFSASIVTPVNYVLFTALTLIASSILFRGFQNTSIVEGTTIILGFLVIVMGVLLLSQYNLKLKRLEDALLLQEVSQQQIVDPEDAITKDLESTETMPLADPRTDIDPFSLWFQTFPLRKKEKRPLPTGPGSSPDVFELNTRRNTVGRTETVPKDNEEEMIDAVVRTSN